MPGTLSELARVTQGMTLLHGQICRQLVHRYTRQTLSSDRYLCAAAGPVRCNLSSRCCFRTWPSSQYGWTNLWPHSNPNRNMSQQLWPSQRFQVVGVNKPTAGHVTGHIETCVTCARTCVLLAWASDSTSRRFMRARIRFRQTEPNRMELGGRATRKRRASISVSQSTLVVLTCTSVCAWRLTAWNGAKRSQLRDHSHTVNRSRDAWSRTKVRGSPQQAHSKAAKTTRCQSPPSRWGPCGRVHHPG